MVMMVTTVSPKGQGWQPQAMPLQESLQLPYSI